jgi:uncharacterized protein (TIGR02145 family)/uncharacterized repeat protein (TIGR01451 family)
MSHSYKIRRFFIICLFVFSIQDAYNQIQDLSGNTYSVKKIGDYFWTLSNLNTSHYANGDPIPQVTDPIEWMNLTTGAWCWYDNDSVNFADKYGKLYNWYALTDPRGLAPQGWHIPTFDEWDNMIQYLGGDKVAGGTMKGISDLWGVGNVGGSNTSGFTGLPGGMRTTIGNFYAQSYYGYWWSTTETQSELVKLIGLLDYNEIVLIDSNYKQAGLSVRCIKDMKGANGILFNDLNQNCTKDDLENIVDSIPLLISPINRKVYSNKKGRWFSDSLPAGNFSLSIDTALSNWKPTCNYTYDFTIINPDSLVELSPIPIFSKFVCVDPEVSIHAPFLRRCFSEQKIFINVKNKISATRIFENGKLTLKLDPFLQVDSSNAFLQSKGDNTFEINIDEIFPGQEITFIIYCTISCNTIINQSLCMEAQLSAYTSCITDSSNTKPITAFPCLQPWDKSSISVTSYCNVDSVYFVVQNNGKSLEGDMVCYTQARIFRDNDLYKTDSIKLKGGESYIYSFLAEGRTWLIQVDQHPLHPGRSFPTTFVEGCGLVNNNMISPNVLNNYPLDDSAPDKDIFCGIVTGAYDPNDKQGYPIGIGISNEIQPNQQLQYVIRFQNTGNDTAFNVIIRDTISENLDINTINSGVSSHNYLFNINGRIAEWYFPQIMLPDSNVNEPASNGFITFTINQIPNLPGASQITNRAAIYFDFNEPIITNTTLHTINAFVYQPNNILSENYHFTAKSEYGYNKLIFQGKNNHRIYKYVIERSIDGKNWIELNTKESYLNPNFEYCDYMLSSEINYYRIKIQQFNNSFTYTDTRIIRNKLIESVLIYPNPTEGNIFIKSSNFKVGKVDLSVWRPDGSLLLKRQLFKNDHQNLFIHLDLRKEANVESGIYLIKVEQSNSKQVLKLLLF